VLLGKYNRIVKVENSSGVSMESVAWDVGRYKTGEGRMKVSK
jgi:hypothetical protein